MIKTIKKRSGEIVLFDRSRIESAILKACEANGSNDLLFVKRVTDAVIEDLEKEFGDSIPGVETIQDVVERNLMKFDKFEIAKSYILYRRAHAKEREQLKEISERKFEQGQLQVLKIDGTYENFDIEKIKLFYDKVAVGYEQTCKFEDLKNSLKNNIIDGIKTTDISKLIVKSCIDLISLENIDWQFIAGRFFVSDIYKKACKNRGITMQEVYSAQSYKKLFDEYIEKGLYYKDFYKHYSPEDILKVGEHLNKDRDFEYNYSTMLMYNKRYLLNPNKIIKELPQEMYMSAALFLAIPEAKEKRLEVALKIYEYCSSAKISLPTPTLMNARTNFCQLSSCFKINLDDDLRAIYHGIENMAQISKFGGGIGVYLGNIRSRGSSIRGVNGASGGVIPWTKVINDTALAVNQLGARSGAISVTLDIWHKDIYNFLDLQTETGDIRSKAFNVFPAVSIPDLFMKRVQDGGNWTLFDPLEVSKLYGKNIQDTYCEEFEKFYETLERDERIKLKTIVNAKDLFKTFMKVVVETGMPYVFFRDTVNRANPNKHKGMVYSSQLCTEICQNTSPAKFVEESVSSLRAELDNPYYVIASEAKQSSTMNEEEQGKKENNENIEQYGNNNNSQKLRFNLQNGTSDRIFRGNTNALERFPPSREGQIVNLKYIPGDTVVCNLASINVAKVNTKEDIENVLPIVMRILDNVITLNFYPVKESEITALKYRSVGLGFLGLAEYLATNGFKYDSPEACKHVDELFEKYALETLKASNEIAIERGEYELFRGSDWEKGILFGRDEKWYKENAKYKDEWSKLIKNIKEKGLRFAYHLAPAPNTSTAGVVGTTAALLPIYKKYFVETNSIAPSVVVAPKLSPANFWLYKEYVNMDMNDVIDMISVIYKWVDQSISFEWLINPSKISPVQLFNYYIKAWKQGIKTIYYVRSMSGEIKDSCVSCSG